MFKRCMRTALRNPDAIGTAIFTPAFLMWLFASLFGNIVDLGEVDFVSFIVPGIILQAVAQATQSLAVGVNNDMRKGIIDRFRSMPISKSAVLTGHVLASVVRNMLSSAIIIGVGFIVGFRPVGGVLDWLAVVGILLVYNLAITWIAVICGLLAKSPEAAGSMLFPLFILPYVSSGFAPTETMTGGFRWFAENQPMSHIIDAMRAFLLDMPLGNSLLLAVAWCVGITIVAFIGAVQIYKRKLA